MSLAKKARSLFTKRSNKDEPSAPPIPEPPPAKPKPAVDLFDIADYPPFTMDTAVLRDTPAQMSNSERLVLFALVYSMRPQRYLEVGTFRGGSALVVNEAMNASQNERGRLYCIDPFPKLEPEHWAAIEPRSQLIVGTSPEILPRVREDVGEPFDFALIDGIHELHATRADAEAVLPLVSDGAYILFHDSLHSEVSAAIDAFVQAHSDELVDLGTLTRDISYQDDPHSGERIRWGGLRAVQVRREISAL